MGDQDERRAQPRPAGRNQPEDLRLDGDVERRGRLVGDDDLAGRRPARGRSSPAGACRPTIRAETAARAARGSGICTSCSISIARAMPADVPIFRCWRTHSAICSPMLSTGLSAVSGSWKIIAICSPRISSTSWRAHGEKVVAIDEDAGLGNLGRLGHEAQQRQRRHRLAAAALADNAQCLARPRH